MLQINTGKLYSRDVERTNQLRGVLFSNLELRSDTPLKTAAGTLLGADVLGGARALVFELEERIEDGPDGPGVLVSHGVNPFLVDFSAVASFGLNAVVVPDAALADRLLSEKPSLAAYSPPKEFIKRCFDNRIWLKDAEADAFTAFVDDLLGLERRHFLAAMRGIRSYVSGVHRLRDDLGVAYTLMVSAIEALAQGFDKYQTTWNDVDERKRRPVDAALKRASDRTSKGVRDAIASTEHASLARRYRAFVKAHLGPEYFRDLALGEERAIASYELDEALRQAYALRSRYLHNLKQLPDDLTHPFGHWETVYVDRTATLTFQGLARLTRHVIREFVARGPKVEREPYDYRREEAGIRFMEMAPQYWVGRPMADAREASRRFEGLLSQLADIKANTPDAVLTDLRPALADIERLAPRTGVERRSAMLALYGLFNSIVAPEQRMPNFREFIDRHETGVIRPSPETLAAFTILGETNTWSVECHRKTLDSYFAKRATPKGLHAPRIFEAAMCLALAERYRAGGQIAEMRAMVSRAVECVPGRPALLALESSADTETPIDWQQTLFPPAPADESSPKAD